MKKYTFNSHWEAFRNYQNIDFSDRVIIPDQKIKGEANPGYNYIEDLQVKTMLSTKLFDTCIKELLAAGEAEIIGNRIKIIQ